MKVVILAGGLGSRLSELTKKFQNQWSKLTKNQLLFIIKHYAKFGFKNFYIASGYKQSVLRNFFKKKIRFEY